VAITNCFSLIPPQDSGLPPAPGKSSQNRLEVATRLLQAVTNVGELKSLLRSHLPEKGGISICNHADGGGTESSHIIQVRGSHVSWSCLIGAPCENDYHTELVFGG
jgi:hypothetical protein